MCVVRKRVRGIERERVNRENERGGDQRQTETERDTDRQRQSE